MEYTLHVEENLIVYNLFVEETIINYSLLVEDDGDTFSIEIGEETCSCFQDCPFGVLSVQGPSVDNTDPRNPRIVEIDPVFTAWLASNPGLAETDPIFSAWLALNPLNEFLTEELDPVFLAWLFSSPNISLFNNDAGYITEQKVEEYPDFASFPLIGEEEVVYIAADTGLFYSWNGTGYDPSSAPTSGISGGGIVNRLPKFTPNGTTLGSSNFSDTGFEGRYSLSNTNFVSFYPTGNIWVRLQRAIGNHMDFILGNPGISQTASLTANNTYGVEIIASAATAFLALKAGGFEGLRVLPTGRILLTQNPDSGNITTDQILVRDPSGNLKQLPYPGSSVNDNWYNYQQIHENMPVFGSPTLNNISGVVYTASGASQRSFSSIITYTRNQRMGLITGTTGNAAQLRQTQLLCTRNSGFDFWFKFGMAENATANDIRFFGGISSNTGFFGNTEPNTLLNAIGIIRPTGSDNFWFMHNDNSGIATTIDLGANFPANTIETDVYIGNIRTSGTSIIITVWRVGTTFIETRTLTTDIPTLTQGLNGGFYIVDSAGPSVATGFDFMGSKLIV